jgi:hypothetical protein
MKHTKRCFVISPIGAAGSATRQHADRVLNSIIEPALKEHAIAPIRADRIRKPGKISEQMFEAIFSSDLCVAVLTGANPNVYYELAVAQSARKPVVILIDFKEKLPFDAGDFRSIKYDLTKSAIYKDEISEYLGNLKEEGFAGEDVFAEYRRRFQKLGTQAISTHHSYECLTSETAARKRGVFAKAAASSSTVDYLVIRARTLLAEDGEIIQSLKRDNPELRIRLLMLDFASLTNLDYQNLKHNVHLEWTTLRQEQKVAEGRLELAKKLARDYGQFKLKLLPARCAPQLRMRLYDTFGYFGFYPRGARGNIHERTIFRVDRESSGRSLLNTLSGFYQDLWDRVGKVR